MNDLKEYIEDLISKINITKFNDGKVILLTLPCSTLNSDLPLSFYLKKEGDDVYISDGGRILSCFTKDGIEEDRILGLLETAHNYFDFSSKSQNISIRTNILRIAEGINYFMCLINFISLILHG